VVTGIVFGLFPAIEASRFDLSEPLKEGGKSVVGGNACARMRNIFVVAQVALALVCWSERLANPQPESAAIS
jgi:hypothetical protein